jgi:hypothetical protein
LIRTALKDVSKHFVSTVGIKINVDVRHISSAVVYKTFKKQIVGYRIDSA